MYYGKYWKGCHAFFRAVVWNGSRTNYYENGVILIPICLFFSMIGSVVLM